MPSIVKQTTKKTKRPSGLASRVKPLGTFNPYLKINLYGRSGTGKTTLWGTFPGPILALICSSLKDPGELLSLNTPEYRKKIKCVTLETSADIGEVPELVASGGYKTVVLDHATGLQELLLKEVLGLEEVPQQLSWGIAKQQDWGKVALQAKTRLKQLLDLESNVVIVAQEREFTPGDENDLVVAPYVASALTPSVVGWLNPACNYICETFIRRKVVYTEQRTKVSGKVKVKQVARRTDDVEYCLRTGADDVYTIKFRVPKGSILPKIIVDPTYDKIREVIAGQSS